MPADVLEPRAERRVVMNGISWELYQQLLAEVGDGHQRLTYYRGRLEIMSPSLYHEKTKKVIARLIEAYADEAAISIEGLGSTTFSDKDLAKGLEPDECYYIAHAQVMIGKREIDLPIDPPPDLAIEIDISPPDVARQPIYAAMGVPEAWRYNGRELQYLQRTDDASYHPVEASHAFPALPPQLMNELLVLGLARGQSAAVAEWRRRLALK